MKYNMLTYNKAVLDDGWFGNKYPRNSDTAGLGDWQVNEKKLKGGLGALVDKISALKGTDGKAMKFGLWVEPEHVNPKSEIYEAHPEWVLQAGANDKTYPLVTKRNQLILDLSKVEVQDHIIKVIGDILASTAISYVKWDNNKAMEQLPTPSIAHAYILGLYRVVDALTTRFPDILWEGCASGGGRFDPGLLHYWPGSWTSDNTDPVDRLHIQTGTSLVYPPSSMSGHISASPNHQTNRATSLTFRAHVAMLCGSFGLELDPTSFSPEETREVPGLIKLSERISPFIVQGDLYRLVRPEESNWPAFMYVKEDGSEAVLLAYQVYNRINTAVPAVRLDGLEGDASYEVEGGETYKGDTLMSAGLRLPWKGDYQSTVLFFKRK
jgi:alpha-galactosidase